MYILFWVFYFIRSVFLFSSWYSGFEIYVNTNYLFQYWKQIKTFFFFFPLHDPFHKALKWNRKSLDNVQVISICSFAASSSKTFLAEQRARFNQKYTLGMVTDIQIIYKGFFFFILLALRLINKNPFIYWISLFSVYIYIYINRQSYSFGKLPCSSLYWFIKCSHFCVCVCVEYWVYIV